MGLFAFNRMRMRMKQAEEMKPENIENRKLQPKEKEPKVEVEEKLVEEVVEEPVKRGSSRKK